VYNKSIRENNERDKAMQIGAKLSSEMTTEELAAREARRAATRMQILNAQAANKSRKPNAMFKGSR
jgi:hypothetical protein